MKKALIFKGQVVQIENQEFPVSPEFEWLDVPETVKVADKFDGEKIVPTVKPEVQTINVPTVEEQLTAIFAGFEQLKKDGAKLPKTLTDIIVRLKNV